LIHARIDFPSDAGIQDVFRHLANDQARTAAISGEIEHAFSQSRKVLVLTERTDHLDAISTAVRGRDSAAVRLARPDVTKAARRAN